MLLRLADELILNILQYLYQDNHIHLSPIAR